MNILVTGSGGFIGCAVADDLRRRKHSFHGFNLPTDDIRDAEDVDRAVKGMDAVIHLAGLLGTDELFDDVHGAIEANIHGTVNVLNACVKHEAAFVGITMPQIFESVYTATKVCATRLATAYHRTYGLPVSHVRAFNVFGPGQAHGLGHPQKIGPMFATEAWANRPIPIWGDGTQTVDLIFVNQLARMMVDALHFGNDEVFDGGTGVALTVNEVADFIIALTDSKAGVTYLPMRRGEVPSQIVATGEGWNRLDWRPEFRWRDLATTVRHYQPK